MPRKKVAEPVTEIELDLKRFERDSKGTIVPYCIDNIYSNFRTLLIRTMLLASDIDVIEYEMTNVKSVDFTKVRGSYNPEAARDKFYRYSELLENKQNQFKFHKELVNSLTSVAENITDKRVKKYILDNYVNDTFKEYKDYMKQYGGI